MCFHLLFLAAMAILGLSAVAPTPSCTAGPYSSIPPASPGCTLSFTPYMPPQIGPTSTVYGGIVTEYIYAVECLLCNVTNVQNNPAPEGPYTTRITSSQLTVTRVECIPETSLTTRGVYGRRDEVARLSPRIAHHNSPRGFSESRAIRRTDVDSVLEEMAAFVNDIAPNAQLLPGPARESAEEIMSAMFALDVADSGMNVALACQQVQTAAARLQMLGSGLQPDLVKNLLCWIADHGYGFNTNHQEVYATLQAALWGLGVAAGYTTNRTEICGHLGLFNTIGDYLGIDVAQYQSLVCSNLASATSSANGSQNATVTAAGMPSNLTTSAPLGAGTANITLWGSGTSWPRNNITTWGPPISYTGTVGSGWSGAGRPQTNNVTSLTGTAAASAVATGNPQTNNVTWATATGLSSGMVTGSPQTYNVSQPAGTGAASNTAAGSPQGINATMPSGAGAASDTTADSPQTYNATQPAGTNAASVTAAELLNQTLTTTCMPPTPTAKLFFPAISTTNSHYLFKRY